MNNQTYQQALSFITRIRTELKERFGDDVEFTRVEFHQNGKYVSLEWDPITSNDLHSLKLTIRSKSIDPMFIPISVCITNTASGVPNPIDKHEHPDGIDGEHYMKAFSRWKDMNCKIAALNKAQQELEQAIRNKQ